MAIAGKKKLREIRRQRRYLTKEELGALIANCPEHFKPFLVSAAHTGARKGELTRLRWADLDFEGKKIALFRPKVGNADWIDMHPAVEAELRRHRAAREAKLAEKDERVLPERHVFLSWHGTPYCEIRRSWQLALKAAGLDGRPGLTPHTLRHSFAGHYLQGGGAATDLQRQLGHAELATTQIYAGVVGAAAFGGDGVGLRERSWGQWRRASQASPHGATRTQRWSHVDHATLELDEATFVRVH